MAYIYAKIKEAVSQEAKHFECISKRYELPYCILLIWYEGDRDLSDLIVSNTRCADRFIKIDDRLYSLLFFANRPDSHATVANKLLYIIERHNPTAKVGIGVACTNFSDEIDEVLPQAIQNLLIAKEHDYNAIEDNF
ncbi:MAG: hypothetical protein GXO19_05830 [Epsilonproteobacteria bacterium]|nr:hypothetical protein [Campylobacterota bacterium]NPA57236.1 hypothetical protein [Campylobacterota bacterium]